MGGIPVGVIQNGIAFFLLIYYNQVLGLDPGLTALALALALVVDAVSDPLVGFISDNWKSKLGRRHPFLLFAAIPTAIVYYFIWQPPTFKNELTLFYYLLGSTVLLRTGVTLFDVPHNALNAELTRNYHERTILATYKVAFSQFAGYVIVLAMYSIWLVPTESQPIGILNADGYKSAGDVTAILVAVTMLLAAAALFQKIPTLRTFAHKASTTPKAFFSQLKAAFSIHSFRIIMLSGIFSAIGGGVVVALWAYIMGYFWEFSSYETFYVLCANFLGALIGAGTAGSFLTRQGKKNTAIQLSILFALISTAPFALRFLGWFPENGSDMLLYAMLVHGVLQVFLSVWIYAITASLTTDIVEHGLLESGYQSEGMILAATTFIQKAGTAGGLIISGVILSVIAFPDEAAIDTLSQEMVTNLGAYYAVATVALYLISTLLLFAYNITQASFERAVEATDLA